MKHTRFRTIAYRALSVLLAAAMLGANLTTLSYASEALETEETYCGQTTHTHEEGVCFTVEKTFICGMEEGELHAHGIDCFEEQQVLICGEEAVEVHTHEEACWEETETYACGLEEVAAHTHGDGCYTDNQKLTCELAECEAHAHGEACYAASRDLTCGLEETAGHAHTEDCVQTESSLCCEKEEIAEGHVHGEACYETRLVQSCGLATEEPHAHSESCYTETIHMTCELEEHVHTETCYLQPEPKRELICEDLHHEHTDECYAPAEKLPADRLEQSITDENGLVSVTGLLPAGAEVQARELTEEELAALPVPVERLLFAYDITIWVDGAEYQPESPVQVTVLSQTMEEPEQEIEVRHAEMDAETLEVTTLTRVESAVNEAGEVTFAAESFSIYFATEPIPTVNIEKDVAYRVYNSSGEAVSGELLWTEAMTLTVKPNTGYQVTGVAVADADSQDTTGNYVSQVEGVYTLTFPTPAADMKNQTVTIAAEKLELQTVTFDIAKGLITLNDEGYSGYNSAGKLLKGAHVSGNRYIITQSEEVTNRRVYVGYEGTAATDYIIELQGINVQRTTANYASFRVNNTATSTVVILLKDGTENFLYSGKQRAGLEKAGGSKGTLLVTCEQGYEEWLKDPNGGHRDAHGFSACDESCGSLDARSGSAWDTNLATPASSCNTGAGIGTNGSGNMEPEGSEAKVDNSLHNLTIAGGVITAMGGMGAAESYSGGAAGIGTGPAKSSRQAGGVEGLKITGGTITAVRGDYSAACIGGGYRAGYVNMEIYGGTITATDINPVCPQTESNQKIRGPGIGGGAGGYNTASPQGTTIDIYGGDITAYSQFGAAIGAGGGGAKGGGSPCTIHIYDGNIYATTSSGFEKNGAGAAIGTGGSLGIGAGGDATIYIFGGTIVANSALGADIGGGGTNSTDDEGVGGRGFVEITGGQVFAENNGIGGGRANAGNGGDADVTISGGRVEASSIGGGDSKIGNGGTATVIVDGPAEIILTGGIGGGQATGATGGNGGSAEVYISDGTILSGSIGGGATANPASKIGYAEAVISGGEITAQFIMAAGGTEPCSFTMTGGRLFDNDVTDETSEYTYASEYGGAVYMDDPNGIVNISGGTIEGCQGKMGGAVYMTNGTVTLSGTGKIQNCEAVAAEGEAGTGNGGAIYMGGGTMNISGGSLHANTAPQSGGAIYMAAGEVNVSDGVLSGNRAAEGNGGAVCMGSGTFTITGGELQANAAATGNGGAISVSGGDLKITGGSITENTASNGFGGGAFIENGNVTMNGGNVDGNDAQTGGGMYVSALSQNVSVRIFSGSISNNHAAEKGGAIAVVGSKENELEIDLTIGVDEIHWKEENGVLVSTLPFNHTETDAAYYHTSCPMINGNTVDLDGNGGAMYLDGGTDATKTMLNLYCLTADHNKVTVPEGDPADRSDFLKVDGGKVIISSAEDRDPPNGNVEGDEKHGNVNIHGSVYVAGGQVDLYGSIGNPAFKAPITVDVDGSATEYFKDHRYNNTETFTIMYFENFEGSGQYTLYHTTYDPASKWPAVMQHIVQSSMYHHPGYELQYWYTDSDATKPGTAYYANDRVWFTDGSSTEPTEKFTQGNLALYGIWKAMGYQVKFNANAPGNASVVGSMENQQFDYLTDTALTKNAYVCPNYYFVGWSLVENADPNDAEQRAKFLLDGSIIEANQPLTTTDGSVVDLYAMWLPCDHDVTKDYAHYVYSVVGDSGDNSVSLRRSCSCGGVHWDRVLSADDATYNGSSHGAVLGSNGSWTSSTVTGPVYRSGSTDLGTDAPVNAGTYTATVTLTDTVEADGATETISATVTYTIHKATQEAPATEPIIREEMRDGKTYVVVTTGVPDSAVGTETEYQMVYYKLEDSQLIKVEMGWKAAGYGGETYFGEEADVAMTNYYVEARYKGNGNYHPSEAVQSKMYVTYEGATVEFAVQPGIVCVSTVAAAGQLKIVLKTEDGYYLENGPGGYEITLTLEEGTGDRPIVKTSGATDEPAEYLLSGIQAGDYLKIDVSGVAKKATIAAQVTERQVYGSMPVGAGIEARISRDSAFTARFTAEGFTGAYSGFALTFNQALPVGSSIILVDKRGAQNTYWYYPAADEGVSKDADIQLTSFKNMADGSSYTLSETLDIHIVVDFSRTASEVGADGLRASLNGEKSNAKVPALGAAVEASLTTVEFVSLQAVSEGYDSLQGNINYAVTIHGAGSKWEGRHMAMVLTPTTELPTDAWLEPVFGTYSARYDINANGQFVVPVGAVQRGSITLQLCSNLLPAEAAAYSFDVEWYVSDSLADAAPINGTKVDKETTLTLRKAADVLPAFRISGDTVVSNGILTAQLEYENVGDVTIEMMVEFRGEDGAYHSSGQSWTYKPAATGNRDEMGISVATNRPGNYRVRVTVLKNNVSLLETAHYFIIVANTAGGEDNPTTGDTTEEGGSTPTVPEEGMGDEVGPTI